MAKAAKSAAGQDKSRDQTEGKAEDKTEGKDAPEGHIAVIYFHGMGSQRRFEETSRLVDRLDSHVERRRTHGEAEAKLRDINARAERNIKPDQPDVTYIEAEYLVPSKDEPGKWDGTDMKFYEAYWADEMAESRSTWAVIKWILRQIRRPVTTILTPWRERQRLHRAFLVELYEHRDDWPEGVSEADFEELLSLYAEFDHPDWFRRAEELRREKKEEITDRFDGFLKMIEDHHGKGTGRTKRLSALATLWHKRYVRHEIGSFCAMASLLLTILLVVGAVAVVVMGLLVRVPVLLDWIGLDGKVDIPDWAAATWGNAIPLGFGVILAIGLRDFLVKRMADVEAWSTYAETDEKFHKREAVLSKSVALLRHAISQPECRRAVVVAHSLGTSVAYDTLLAAVHANRAANPQEPMTGRVNFNKISHFVTLAAPVDKIAYFFESFRSPVRRYRKIYNALRGDIGTAPFSKSGRQPHIHWVNIWDRADIIAGPLQSPSTATGLRAKVDNVHVNTLTHFNPGRAHGAYFDHRGVIGILSDVVFENRGQYTSDALEYKFDEAGNKDGLDYRAVDFGPGSGEDTWGRVMLVGLIAPWAWLVWLVLGQAGAEAAVPWALGLAALLTAVPVGAAALALVRRPASSDPME